MVEWSHAFGNAPIHLHIDTAVGPATRPRHPLLGGGVFSSWTKVSRCTAVAGISKARLYSCGRMEQRALGVLLSGDTMYVAPDRRHVSFMYSYPNSSPLGLRQLTGLSIRLCH